MRVQERARAQVRVRVRAQGRLLGLAQVRALERPTNPEEAYAQKWETRLVAIPGT